MVKHDSTQRLDLVFHTLADPTRREILCLMSHRAYTVSELAKPFDMSLAAISKHLKIIEKSGLLYRKREGRICHCYLDSNALIEAAQVISQLQTFWTQQFDYLEQFLEQPNKHRRIHNMKIEPLILKKTVPAPIEKVFEAWSNPEMIKLWLKPDFRWQVSSENIFEVGGNYEFVMLSEANEKYTHVGEYKEIVPPSKIVFSWNSNIVQNTLVTIKLKEVDGKTELTLIHDLFPTEELKEQHHQGWAGCLENLTHCLANK